MPFKNKTPFLFDGDITINRFVLLGILLACPLLHHLCYYNNYDPVWLRVINMAVCLPALLLSYGKKNPFRVAIYFTIISNLVINNYLLLGNNNFAHTYLLNSLVIFTALTLFCKKRVEFLWLAVVNTIALFCAYFFNHLVQLNTLLFTTSTFIAITYVAYLVTRAYQARFNNAVNSTVVLNQSLQNSAQQLEETQQQLHSLISSINDTIFEFDENRICINVWFGPQTPPYLKKEHFLNKTLLEAIGEERARPFTKVYDYVIQHKKPYSVEFASIYGEPGWFLAKASPVIDIDGNYTKRISVSVTEITEQKKFDDALIENKDLLMQAQRIAKIGNWWYDAETSENFWSESLYNILEIDDIPAGLSKFDYYMQMVHPDDFEAVRDYLNNINTSAASSIDHKFNTPKGNLKYLKILRGELQVLSNGQLKRVVGIIQDITESKLNEKALKISQAELLEAQTIAKIGNWKWDSRNKILSWSDEINSIFEISEMGVSSSRFGKILLQYTHPNDVYIARNLFKGGDSSGNSYEYRIITPKGHIKYISVITGKLMYREDGSVRKIIGTLQDITQRKQAEIAHRRTENKYRLVLETIKLAAVSLNAQGKVIFCNKYLANLLGYTQTEIMGMDWMEHFVPREHSDIITGWFSNDSIKAHYVNPIICRDGEQRIISWQNTVSYDENGHIKETTSIGEDITVQQKVRQELIMAKEQAERSSHFKSEFLSIMSHEIRTPMNAVIGTTNLLLEEDPKPEQMEYLNILKFSSENLLAIINDILDYNKIEAGKLVLSHLPFNIHQLIQNIRQSFYAKAVQKNLDIALIDDQQIPLMLNGDQTRLSQILINLVSNAVKFTHKGKVTIAVQQQEETADDVLIKFTIADTGIGMSAENLAVVFDPFIQGPQTITHEYGGTGLGLAITKRLIELHQSNIEVNSELGKGTAFTFAIRFGKTQVEPAIATFEDKKDSPALPVSLQGRHILVVDDNKMNLMIAAKFLKKWDAKVSQAINGQLAIDLLTTGEQFDLIIMDLQMPVMDGFEATAIIKASYPHIPVIAFTADAMPETHKKAFDAGMCDYLTKPFAPEALFEKVSKYCNNQPSPQTSGIQDEQSGQQQYAG
ncbi:hypothetical protein CKK33_09685 [Mucilaginibacter sp. MD40]|uniref:PAS domain S-box protein n=1 Tax=Mucilaginibacter sp. MD40 TaxID=2029590 RepID=UPI000BACC057|nr:PAS domain S-box protein [Mucilaginibacter sp. MD40]PAW93749.1 hypothetical protein CKK33_09685 [Mucilaginibacter sp. MD40]